MQSATTGAGCTGPRSLRRLAAWTWAAALCLTAPVALAAEGQYGGTLTVGTEIDPLSLDPLQVSSYVGSQYALAIFDTLFEIDASGRVVPGLAESYTVSTDGLLYTLKLREGVRFHDGSALDAAAGVFNLERVRNPENHCRCLVNVSLIEKVQATGPRTVQIRLRAPMASLPAVLAGAAGMMASPKAVQADGRAFGMKPVGSGPFRLVEWTKSSRFVAERNPDYWKPGRPFLDKVVFKGLQNGFSREATIRSGDFDIITSPPPTFVTQARDDKRLSVMRPNGFGAFFIALRMTHPQLKDPRVRLALAHATDRPQLLKVMFYDPQELATTPFGKGQRLRPDEVADYPAFNPARAKALLAEYGQPVRLLLTSDNTQLSLRVNQVLQQMWRAVGVEVDIRVIDTASLIRAFGKHEFDVALFRLPGSPDPDLNVYPLLYSRLAERALSSNFVQYANPQMDELLNAGRREPDPLERRKIYSRIAALLAKDLPYIFISYAAAPLIFNPAVVKGIAPMPDSLIRVGEVWKETSAPPPAR